MNTFIVNGKHYTYKEYILYSIAAHGGKMAGIPSISTSVLKNTNCEKNAKIDGSICSKCYARNYVNMRKGLRNKLESNFEFYTSVLLSPEDIPFINSAIFRFESFGDLANVTQFTNYCTIARNNPRTTFALWTKHIHVIVEYIRNGGIIPSNLYIIESSLLLNKSSIGIRRAEPERLPFIDGVFTVYDESYIKNNGVEINCGSRNCAECRRCYSLEHGRVADIREKLK